MSSPVTYLDHAATTPMLAAAVEAMSAALSRTGNASSLHTAGRRARRDVEEGRERIAAAVGARPSEVVLTTGGTESDNLAVKGLYWARRGADDRRRRVLVSAIEHHAVLDSARWLAEHEGAQVEVLPVDRDGRVQPEALAAALAAEPESAAVVSVMWANNEVGTVNPVRELAAVAHRYGVPIHTDAVQAVGHPPGGLRRVRGRRAHRSPGTSSAARTARARCCSAGKCPSCRCCTAASRSATCAPARSTRPRSSAWPPPSSWRWSRRRSGRPRSAALRDDLVGKIRATVPDAVLNGDPGTGRIDGGPSRLPGNAHLSFPGCEGDSLLMLLDAQGIECSTGSACTAGVAQPSHVLLAMGADEATARGSLRFSLGHTTTAADVERVTAVIGQVVERARRAGQSR